jgi:hypothetical protein
LKSVYAKAVGVLIVTGLVMCCKKETTTIKNPKDLLIGQWNLHEAGTGKNGFTSFDSTSCGCLTFFYDDGISFSMDGTFSPRYQRNGTWLDQGSARGNFEFNDRIIVLIVSPGTKDEIKLNLQLIKLDEKQLWFRHSLFVEREYHLIRNR